MAEEVVMPKQGNSVESCTIVEWMKKEGDPVSRGDVLCLVETDKTQVEVEAEQEGTVLSLFYEEGDDVPVMQPMMILGKPGEDISSFMEKREASQQTDTDRGETSPESSRSFPESSQADSGERTRDVHGAGSGEGGPASPRARKAAAGKGVDLSAVSGSGPGGRILEKDVLGFAAAHPPVTPAARDAGVTAGSSGSGIGGRVRLGEEPLPTGDLRIPGSEANVPAEGKVEEIPVTGIRKVIASRMTDSLQTTAQFTLNSLAPASDLLRWRENFKKSDEKLGLRNITLGDMISWSVSRLLPFHPGLNGTLSEGVIRRYEDVHLGIAVDTPRGLMVPVIRYANRKSLKSISAETAFLASQCREGTINPDLLQGGTFTISNLGSTGVQSFTPVINAPEIAILGVCAVRQAPVLKEGETLFEPHIGFSMTIDHQAVDGAPAARFLQALSRFLESMQMAAAL